MKFRDDDGGAFQAFEAVLVAILIGGAILFVSATSNPVLEATGTSIDLTGEAQAAALLMSTTFSDDLDAAIYASLSGGGAANWEDLVGKTLDDDFRFVIQLDNGVGALQLYPNAGAVLDSPRGAVQGSAYIKADWIDAAGPSNVTLGGSPSDLPEGPLVPTDELRYCFGPSDCHLDGPGGTPWIDIWTQQEKYLERIPYSMPLGLWKQGAAETEFYVLQDELNDSADPTLAINLLIWDGAV